MMYLYNSRNAEVVGIFGEYSSIEDYYVNEKIVDRTDFIILMEASQMTYISKICYVNGEIIYNNKDFWLNVAPEINEDFHNHSVLDWRGRSVTELEFKNEFRTNFTRISNVKSHADEVAYNIKVGAEYISLFREESISTPTDGIDSGLGIATSLSQLIPLVQTGSFKEAVIVMSFITRTNFLNDGLLKKYSDMLRSADIITYE